MRDNARWPLLIGALALSLVAWWAMRTYAPCWLLDLYGKVPLYRLDECRAKIQ